MSEGRSFGVMRYDSKYYFSDSHSHNPMGAKAKDNGRACIIECDNLDEFVNVQQVLKNVQITIDYVDDESMGHA